MINHFQGFKNINCYQTLRKVNLQNLINNFQGFALDICLLYPNFLISALTDSSIVIIDIETSKIISHFKAHNNRISKIQVIPESRSLVSVSEDRSMKIWDLQNSILCNQRNFNYKLTSLDINKENLAITGEQSLHVISRSNLKDIFVEKQHSKEGDISCVKFSKSNPSKIMTVGYDQNIIFYDTKEINFVTNTLYYSQPLIDCVFIDSNISSAITSLGKVTKIVEGDPIITEFKNPSTCIRVLGSSTEINSDFPRIYADSSKDKLSIYNISKDGLTFADYLKTDTESEKRSVIFSSPLIYYFISCEDSNILYMSKVNTKTEFEIEQELESE